MNYSVRGLEWLSMPKSGIWSLYSYLAGSEAARMKVILIAERTDGTRLLS